MFVSRSVHFTLAVVCTLSLAGCIIAVDRKAETPKVDADTRIVRQVRVETHVKDDAVPATSAALLPKLAEVRLLLSKDPTLQGEARTRVLTALDEQIARVAVLKSSP